MVGHLSSLSSILSLCLLMPTMDSQRFAKYLVDISSVTITATQNSESDRQQALKARQVREKVR